MREYFVSSLGNDTDPGTMASPWRTVAKVNAFAFQAGDVIRFRRGDTWREMLNPPRDSLTFADYGPASAAAPIFSGLNPGGTARPYCVIANGRAHHCRYENLVCEGAGNTGFFVDGASDQHLRNIVARNNGTNGFSLKGNNLTGADLIAHHNGVVGIAQDGAYHRLRLTNPNAHHNCFTAGRAGIWLSLSVGAIVTDADCYENGTNAFEGVGLSMYGTTGCTFRRCLSHNNYGNGILTIRNEARQIPTTGALIDACKTYGNKNSVGNLASGIRLDTRSEGGRVRGCESYGNASAGIVIEDYAMGNRLEFNLVHGNARGITFSNNASLSNRAEHNTIYGNSDAGIAIEGNFEVMAPYIIKNNIIQGNGTGLRIDRDGLTPRHDINHNLYFGNDRAVDYGGTAYADSAIDAFSGETGYEVHGRGGQDPQLTNATQDIRPERGSPCVNAGTPPGEATTDYYGVMVPAGDASDIGAAVFVPVPIGVDWTE